MERNEEKIKQVKNDNMPEKTEYNFATNWFIKNAIDKWYCSGKRDLNVMVFGKTGIGKSTLLNSLFQQPDLFKTGDLDTTTIEIEKITCLINGVPINFYDTPGLLDDKNNDKVYFEKIKMSNYY